MRRVTRVLALPDFRLDLTFDDGTHAIVSIDDRLFGPMFEPLRDELTFARVSVDSYGVVCWPNGADLDSDTLYARATNAAREASLA